MTINRIEQVVRSLSYTTAKTALIDKINEMADAFTFTGLPEGYINGGLIEFVTVSQVRLNAVQCKDSTDAVDIRITTPIILDPTSAVGSGGLDQGTEAANTWYAIVAIQNGDGTLTGAMLVADPASIVLPSGFTVFRVLGWVRNNASSDFIDFHQVNSGTDGERIFVYRGIDDTDTRFLTAGVATTPTNVICSDQVPPDGVSIILRIELNVFSPGSLTRIESFNDGQNNSGYRFPAGIYIFPDRFAVNNTAKGLISGTRQIGYHVPSASDNLTLAALGFVIDI